MSSQKKINFINKALDTPYERFFFFKDSFIEIEKEYDDLVNTIKEYFPIVYDLTKFNKLKWEIILPNESEFIFIKGHKRKSMNINKDYIYNEG